MKKKIIVWALFDSGNGCYKQVAENYEEMEIFSIGLDVSVYAKPEIDGFDMSRIREKLLLKKNTTK